MFSRDLDKCRIIGTLREKHLGDKNEHFQVTTWLSRSIVQRLCPHRRSPESESDLRPFVGRHLSLILCHSPAVQSNKANKKQKRERSFPLNQDSYRTCHICQNTSISWFPTANCDQPEAILTLFNQRLDMQHPVRWMDHLGRQNSSQIHIFCSQFERRNLFVCTQKSQLVPFNLGVKAEALPLSFRPPY